MPTIFSNRYIDEKPQKRGCGCLCCCLGLVGILTAYSYKAWSMSAEYNTQSAQYQQKQESKESYETKDSKYQK